MLKRIDIFLSHAIKWKASQNKEPQEKITTGRTLGESTGGNPAPVCLISEDLRK